MQWIVELDASGDFVRVSTRDSFTVDGYRGMVDDILSRPFWRPGSDVLFDHRKLGFADVDFDVMRGTTEYHIEHDEKIGDGRAAIVVGNKLGFANARQFEALLGGKARARLRIFRELDAAVAWLTRQMAPDA